MLPFPNGLFPVISPPSFGEKGVSAISPTVSDFLVLYQDESATISWILGPFYPGSCVEETNRTSLFRVVNDRFYCLLNTMQLTSLQEA